MACIRWYCTIAISARHCHVNEEDFYYLFGRDAALQKWKELSQPGQFASQHVLTIKGPKGQIDKVRVLGPFRTATQIEISQTDAIKLGVIHWLSAIAKFDY